MSDEKDKQEIIENPTEGFSGESENINVSSLLTKEQQKLEKILNEEASQPHRITGMFRGWYLDYASYVILERAVPHLEDGLKPVQRRILHSLKRMDDGRYNKVANIIGHTMQFHPHGDASIGDALVGLGQKELLVDTQGNWGNILTGDSSAAPRYIEARLTQFAQEVVFNNKTTEWMNSYDGRNKEPVTLPVKFPLLLFQGAEGIAVGLASKILPHNFIELIECSIKVLKNEPFTLYPDFPTGGIADFSKYNDGIKGGTVKIRAKINKVDARTLTITEIPYSKTTSTLIESIAKANDTGKIKIKKIDDNTAATAEILLTLGQDVSADKTIDALYAFTDCEISISPNSCVVYDGKPLFMGVSEILRHNTERTRYLLGRELEIKLSELNDAWHQASLEKIFIENHIYNLIEKCTTKEAVYETIDKALEPFKNLLRREVVHDDIVHLTELKIMRISRYDAFKADQQIKSIEDDMKKTQNELDHLTEYTVRYFENLLKKYGEGRERKTRIESLDSIEAFKVAENNAKLYVNRAEGFYGIGNQMKKEEFVSDCSDVDDIIVFTKEGKYIVSKVSDKRFFEKNIYYLGVFKKSDDRTIYNVIYRDGKAGAVMMKRCAITSITRDKVYDMTKGTPGSEILYMSVNPNGEAETLKIYLKARARIKNLIIDLDFSNLLIKGRSSQGNRLTRYAIHKIVLKERGISTLAAIKVWWEPEVRKLNNEGRGILLGEFESDDKIIVFAGNKTYYTNGYELSQHFPDDVRLVEKWDPDKVYTAVYINKELDLHYIKRFTTEDSNNKVLPYIDENDQFVLLNGDRYPHFELVFGGKYKGRSNEEIDVADFIGAKSAKAKGKRLSTLIIDSINILEPYEREEEDMDEDINAEDMEDNDEGQDNVDDYQDNPKPESDGKENGKYEKVEYNDPEPVQLNLFDEDN